MNRFIRAFYRHRHLLAFTGIYMIVVVVGALALGASPQTLLGTFGYLVWGLFASLFFFMAVLLYYLMRGFLKAPRNRHYLKSALDEFEDGVGAYLTSDRFPDAIAAILILFPVSFVFCIAKSMIPTLHPYSLDPALSHLDLMLHGWKFPHEYISPWIEAHNLSHALDGFYLTWFVMLYFVIEICIFADPDAQRRQRFMWAYSLSWLIAGNILAALLSSTGPLFWPQFYPHLANPYAGLLQHLQVQNAQSPMDVISTAKLELELTKNGHVIDINAISAMPSMHVLMAALMALYMNSINRWVGALFSIYLFLIVIGSIYLGWHYAVDGYVGMALALTIWLAAKPLAARTSEHGAEG